MKRDWQILVVDHDEAACQSLTAWLGEYGYTVDIAMSGREAIAKARVGNYVICFIALNMPAGMEGAEIIMQIRRLHGEASIIVTASGAAAEAAVAAANAGAEEYLVKPCTREELALLMNRVIKARNLARENTILRKKLSRRYTVRDVISKNTRMHEILSLARQVANLPSPVLIQGESGTGKELIARVIHYSSAHASRPMVGVSCGALSEPLIEAELFGSETSAAEPKPGKFALADGGTILLDEIGALSPRLQAELLRVLQDGTFRRMGGSEEVHVDVRVIATTRANLQQAVAEGRFRSDLVGALSGVELRVPPLRDRREDIPLLADHLLERISHELCREIGGIGQCAMRLLMDYHWPGNVRELENALERAVITCRGPNLLEEHFPFLAKPADDSSHTWRVPAGASLEEMEKVVISATLDRTGRNIKESAGILGIDRSTLYEKIKKYGIPR